MKLLFVFASLLLLQSAFGDDGGVTNAKKCEDFLGANTCSKLRSLAKLLHEKTTIITDAINDAIIHHKTKATEMLAYIKVFMAERLPCAKVLTDNLCTKIRDLGTRVHLTALQVSLAIEKAVANGADTVQNIYKNAISILTEEITCSAILGDAVCNNFKVATQELKEKSILIKEAIVAAVLKHTNNVKDIIQSVKNTLVAKAVNFTCIDVLTKQQCDFLGSLQLRFLLRASELHKVLVETIVNGTNTAAQIYKITLGKFIEDAKNVKCENLISPDVCNALGSFAKNFHIKRQEVTLAVKVAIANGLNKTTAIYTSVRSYLVEIISCDNFLPKFICDRFESLANRLHVSHKKITDKIRSLAANGVTRVTDFVKRITTYIWKLFFGYTSKRSINSNIPFVDMIMKFIERVINVGKDIKEKMVTKIKKAIEKGKVTLLTVRKYIKDLIQKYMSQSDQQSDEDQQSADDIATIHKSLIDQLKETVKKLHGKAKELMKKLLTKSKEQLQKLKDLIKQIFGNQGQSDEALDMTNNLITDMAHQQINEEAEHAEQEIEKMIL